MKIACILPVKGRHAQTVANAARLVATAGITAEWIAVGNYGDSDDEHTLGVMRWEGWTIADGGMNMSYWHALDLGMQLTDAPLIATLANDLLPAMSWLSRAVTAYQLRFGDTPALMGFNGDGHGAEHSCHMLIHRDLVQQFGGFPVWYRHNFGDTEFCMRAHAIGRYAKAPYAILYHDHPITGKPSDEVYQIGNDTWAQDEALFHQRRARGWV